MLSGSAYRVSVPVPASSFRLLTGTPKTYVKTADSGTRRRHGFCANCGSPIWAAADSDTPPTYTLRVGALAWSEDLSGLPAIDGQPS